MTFPNNIITTETEQKHMVNVLTFISESLADIENSDENQSSEKLKKNVKTLLSGFPQNVHRDIN